MHREWVVRRRIARSGDRDTPGSGTWFTTTRLSETDVLLWWGHIAHAEVADEIVERVQKRVLEGMGLIVLHSGHYSKIFKRLMGTTCSLIGAKPEKRKAFGSATPAIRSPKESRPTSKSPTKRCTANRSEFPLRTRRSLFPGSREGKSFAPAAAGKGATAKSFIFVPVTSLFRPIANRKCKPSFKTPCIGWRPKARVGSTRFPT